jgi:hypothetical protein
MLPTENCGTCCYWLRDASHPGALWGDCRRRRPDAYTQAGYGGFPHTPEAGWCGEWERLAHSDLDTAAQTEASLRVRCEALERERDAAQAAETASRAVSDALCCERDRLLREVRELNARLSRLLAAEDAAIVAAQERAVECAFGYSTLPLSDQARIDRVRQRGGGCSTHL